ncbi:hypothetical protein [Streptosporangium sp. NPDC001681]
MHDVAVDPQRIIAALRRRIDELIYENAILAAGVDQLQAKIDELTGG